MKKRGLIITIIGIIAVGISLSIAVSAVPSSIISSDNFSVSSLFAGMFNEISNEIQILSGDYVYFSYTPFSSDVHLLWGIQIVDYQYGDKLSIKISNIFDNNYGEFIQDEFVLFEMLEVIQSETLNLEIQNIGPRNVNVIVMFSEDPENSDALSNPDSPVMNMIFSLTISVVLLFLGIIILIIGIIVILVDLKNNQNYKRNY